MFFLEKNRCETDLCSKQMGGENPLDDGIKKRNAALCFEILTKRSCKRSNFNRLVKVLLSSSSYNYRPVTQTSNRHKERRMTCHAYRKKQNGSGICSWIHTPDGAVTTSFAAAAPTRASKVFALLWWLVPTTKASEKKGAKKRTKPPQIPKIGCGDESIRRRNKRAAHEKKTAKHAPFSYRKRHLTVLPRKRRKSALTQLR